MTPKTQDSRTALLKNAAEFLDTARQLDGQSHTQQLLNGLKTARGIITDLTTELWKVVQAPIEKARPKKEKRTAIVPGLDEVRKEIFWAPINRQNWENGLLLAMNTGKQMGFERFELELHGDLLENAAGQSSPSYSNPMAEMMGLGVLMRGQLDEWQRLQGGKSPTIHLFAWSIG